MYTCANCTVCACREENPEKLRIPNVSLLLPEKKLSFTKMEDVEKRAVQAIRKKQPLVFQWRGGYLTREVLAQLLETCSAQAERKQLYPRLALNWPQAVLQLQFEPQLPSVQLVMQEANEGEQYGEGGET